MIEIYQYNVSFIKDGSTLHSDMYVGLESEVWSNFIHILKAAQCKLHDFSKFPGIFL